MQSEGNVLAGVKTMVGYHNYYRVDVFDAQKRVQSVVDRVGLGGGWMAGVLHNEYLPIPDGAVRVGQVTVRHGDWSWPLIVRRIAQGGE